MCLYPTNAPATAYQKGCKCDRCREYKKLSKQRQRQNPEMRDREKALERERYKNSPLTITKNARYRARKKNCHVPLSESEKLRIQEIYKKAKDLTKLTGTAHHVDHIIPLSRGGLHHPDNLQILTARENILKGNKLLKEFMDGIEGSERILQSICTYSGLNGPYSPSGWTGFTNL